MSASRADDGIERSDGPTGGSYRLRIEGSLAEMTFSLAGATLLIIDHTDVPEALRGRGVGDLLVARAVADARAEGKKIIPLCPFAASRFRKHPEYANVLSR